MSSRKTKILMVSSVVALVLLAVGGIFIWKSSNSPKNISEKTNNEPNQPAEKCFKCGKDCGSSPIKKSEKIYCSQKCADNGNSGGNDDNGNQDKDKNKIELKVFWSGQIAAHDEYSNYWNFVEGEKWSQPKRKWFLIPKNTPSLVGKDLWQEDLVFTLAYSKEQGSKVEKTDKDGEPRLTVLESNFTLTPISPIKNDPDFLNRWENTESRELYFDYSKYTGGDYVFIDNHIQGGRDEKDLDKFVFHPDNPSIQKLLAQNLLQNQPKRNDKEFRVFWLERDIEKRVFLGNSCTYYFNNQAQVKRATN